MLVVCAACGTTLKDAVQPGLQSNGDYYPVAVDNYNSNKERIEISFQHAPQRVYALHQNSIETLLALGLEDRIVGCAGDIPPTFKNADYKYREGFSKANYSDTRNPSLEDVLILKPDLILGWHSTFLEKSLGTTNFWRERSVATYMAATSNGILAKKTVEDEYRYILDMGKIFNRQQEAAAIVKAMEDQFKFISVQTAQKTRPKTMVIEMINHRITVYGNNQLAGNMLTRLGADVIDSGATVSYEELIALNPDVLFIAYMGDDGQKYVDQLLQSEALASLACVQNRRVYSIPLTCMYASATQTLDGIRIFTAGLYPNLEKF